MHQAKLPSKQLQVSLCDEKEFFEMVEADHLPRRHNELPSMELSWAWEPANKKRAHRNYTGKRSLCRFFSQNSDRHSKARDCTTKH